MHRCVDGVSHMCCRVLPCVAVCCRNNTVIAVPKLEAPAQMFCRCVAARCVTVCCSVVQYVAVRCSGIQRCSVLQCWSNQHKQRWPCKRHNAHVHHLNMYTADLANNGGWLYRNILQHSVTHCNTLQRTATHCNTLQHNASKHTNTLRVQWF